MYNNYYFISNSIVDINSMIELKLKVLNPLYLHLVQNVLNVEMVYAVMDIVHAIKDIKMIF